MQGIINVLKPPGLTSHDMVNIIRRLLGERKIGHTGTLDPGAAGVLPMCVGKATKVAQYFTDSRKVYRGEVVLGYSTTSQDLFGEKIGEFDASDLQEEDFLDALDNFRGWVKQIPPMHSAVRVRGKKLYELARKGKVVERDPRHVYIYGLRPIKSEGWGTKHPRVLLEIDCSKGTFIRTLFSDIGDSLKCGAAMSFLLRTKVGQFDINNSWTIEEITNAVRQENREQILMSLNEALSFLPAVLVRPSATKPVCSGAMLYPPGVDYSPPDLCEGNTVRLCSGEQLLALAKVLKDDTEDNQRLIYKVDCVLV